MKLKKKWYRSNDYSQKWRFYWVITWKFLFSGGIDFWWEGTKNLVGEVYWGGEGDFPGGRGGMSEFWPAGGDSPHPPSRENPGQQVRAGVQVDFNVYFSGGGDRKPGGGKL